MSEPTLLDDGELYTAGEGYGLTPVQVPPRGQQSQTATGFGAEANSAAGSRTASFGQAGLVGASQAALRSQHTAAFPALNPSSQTPFASGVQAARGAEQHLPPIWNASQNTGRPGVVQQSPLVSQRPSNKLSYSEKEKRLRNGLELQVKKNNLLALLGKKQAKSLQLALSEFETRLSQEKEGVQAAELTLIERARAELIYLEYRDQIVAIMKNGSRKPLKDEEKEATAQRKRQALEGIRVIFSEIGLDEKGESTRFSTRNENYVALKDPLTPELMEARARAKEWSHELDVPERLGFDDKTMSTVRKYVVPPQAVHDVVVAFFLLLGEHEADTRDWKFCRKLLNPYGGSPGAVVASTQEQQGGLREKIERFDLSTVDPEVAAMAKEILEKYTLSDICKTSECVGPFYLWTTTIIEQLEKEGKLATLPTKEETNSDPAIIQAAKDELAQKNPTTIDPRPDEDTLRRVWRTRRQRTLLETIRARFNILNEKTINQLRLYKAPPKPVHEILQAFFLLLGETEHYTRNWKNVRKLLEPLPKDAQPSKEKKGIMRPKSWLECKLDAFQVNCVNGEIAAMAKEILDQYKVERIRKLNEATVPFYLWSYKALNDVEMLGNMATLPPFDVTNDPSGSVRYANLCARQVAILHPKTGTEEEISAEAQPE